MSKPTFTAYTVREYRAGKEVKSSWCRIGAAWPLKNGGEGFSITLDALPIDGRVILMPPKRDEPLTEQEPEQGEPAGF